MDNNPPTWFSFIKKIYDFFAFVISFFRRRKEIEKEKQKEKFDKVVSETKTSFDNIDKEKQAKQEDDLNKRLKNLF
jgi:hypothetical protein